MDMLNDLLKSWHFDIKTAVVTFVLTPIALILAKVLKQHIRQWASFLIEGVFFWLARVVRSSMASKFSLSRYCRLNIQQENQYLFVPSKQEVKLKTDEVFVTLTLETPGLQHRTITHSDLLSLGPRMVVVGDPGSGKSSLVKRVFRDACQEGARRQGQARLPILVELKKLEIPPRTKEHQLGRWFLAYLRERVARFDVYRISEAFDIYVKGPGLLILLDGLDEVASQKYKAVHAAINALSDELGQLGSGSIVVMTMRQQFYQQVKDDFREKLGPTLYVKPFTPSDIYEFLTRWPFGADRTKRIASIYKELTERPTLREMCTNPLVLAMYVAGSDQSGAVAPESRAEFYLRVTEELVVKRRVQQTGRSEAALKLKEQRERVLGRLAYEHLLDSKQPPNSLRWTDAIRTVRDIRRCTVTDAEDYLFELAKETGVIAEEKPRESLRFIHLTFCEFLAAYEATQGQKHGWSNLLRAHAGLQSQNEGLMRSRLLEVIPFACGLLTRAFRPEAVQQVVTLSDFRLIARCFIETKVYEIPEWRIFVDQTMEKLAAVDDANWHQGWLQDLYLFNVMVSDAIECARHGPIPGALNLDLKEFHKEILNKQQSSIAALLTAFAGQDAAAALALSEVCGVDLVRELPEIIINNADQAPFFGLLVAKCLAEPDRSDDWARVLSEAGLRSRLVARWLYGQLPAREFNVVLKKSGIPTGWTWFYFCEATFYSQLLALGLVNPGTFAGLRLVRSYITVNPGIGGAILHYAVVLGGLFVAVAFAIAESPLRQSVNVHMRLVGFTLGFLAPLGGYYTLFRVIAKRRFFLEVLNAASRPSGVSLVSRITLFPRERRLLSELGAERNRRGWGAGLVKG